MNKRERDIPSKKKYPKPKEEKSFHFMGEWLNGDPIVICSYGRTKKDAFIKMLKARKEGKFQYRKYDGFHMTYDALEDYKNRFKIHGHTTYIVRDGKVEFN